VCETAQCPYSSQMYNRNCRFKISVNLSSGLGSSLFSFSCFFFVFVEGGGGALCIKLQNICNTEQTKRNTTQTEFAISRTTVYVQDERRFGKYTVRMLRFKCVCRFGI
jgi:hypothetical protein